MQELTHEELMLVDGGVHWGHVAAGTVAIGAGAFGVYKGIKTANPMKIFSGAATVITGISTVWNAF